MYKDINQIKKLLEIDLKKLNKTINKNLYSNVNLTVKVLNYIFNNHGKQIRAILLILSCYTINSSKIFKIKNKEKINKKRNLKFILATAIEFIHAATLLHDDVIDFSSTRRGKKTINKIWNNQTSILIGDFLYSRASQLISNLNTPNISQIIANVSNEITEGEILQLENQYTINNNSEKNYLEIIKEKTASLFSAATKIGASISTNNIKIINSLAKYGQHIGIAFQLTDDLLDYSDTKKSKIGKDVGVDLKEGKATMPLIYAFSKSNSTEKKIIKNTLNNKFTNKSFLKIKKIILEKNAFEYTEKLAKKQINTAKSHLKSIPNSTYKEMLINLADFIVLRKK